MKLLSVLINVRIMTSIALALISLGLVPLASGQVASMLVDVPFAFHDASHSFSAGQYLVQSRGDNIVLLRSMVTDRLGFSMTQGELRGKALEQGKLVFHKYGEQYFLSDIWLADRTLGRQVLMGKVEKQLRKALPKQRSANSEIALNERQP